MSKRKVSIIHSMHQVSPEQWDALAADAGPFLEWGWLASLEDSGCVGAGGGWGPHHLIVEEAGKLVAACPLYVKGHSEGEFVFDYEWAYAAQSAGVEYYPKLLVAVPFTPATGRRFLLAPQGPRKALLQLLGRVLIQVLEQNTLSGIHINFCHPEEVEALLPLGFMQRTGIQYHWHNHQYTHFDDYLDEFRSKRRTKLKREIKEMDLQGIRIEALSGDEISDELVPVMYRLYQNHIEKLHWGRLYLNEEFFKLLASRFRKNLCFIVARQDERVLAGTFNVQKDGVFHGRYWGAFEERHHLHFNVCYYAAIRHCVENGLHSFEPGAGGDFKRLRGFDPTPTNSLHYLRHPGLREAVREFLEAEARHKDRVIEHLNENSPLRVTRERMTLEELKLDVGC